MNRRLLTYTSYAYLVSYAFTITNMGPCNAPMANEFGLGERMMGLLIAAHFSGFIAAVLFAGFLADRVALKPVMIASVAILGVSMVGIGASHSVVLLFVIMFLAGIGGGSVEACVNALISRMYRETRVYSLNLLHVYFGVGAFTWPMVAGALLGIGASWRILFYAIGAFSLLSALALAVQEFPEQGGADDDVLRISDMVKMLGNRSVLLIGLVIAFYVGGEMGINAWIVRYFDEVLLHGDALAGVLKLDLGFTELNIGYTSSIFLTLYWFTMTVGRLFATAAGRFMEDRILLRIMALSSTITCVMIFMVDNYVVAAVFLALTGFCFSGIFATTVATGGNRFPGRPGIIGGIIIGFSGVGNVGFAAGIGAIAQSVGLRAGMLFAAAMLGGMTICSFLIEKAPDEKLGEG